jgi:hypothetical protein
LWKKNNEGLNRPGSCFIQKDQPDLRVEPTGKIMKYEKLTIKAFKDKLEDGQYDSLTGARRAVGKVSGWSEGERDKARTLADKYFGADSTEKTTAKAKGKGGKKKKAAKKAAAKRTSKAPKAAAAASKPGRKKRAQTTLGRTQLIGEYVGTISQAIAAMDAAKSHGMNVDAGMAAANEGLTNALIALKDIAFGQKNGISYAAVAKRFADTAPAAGPISEPPASSEQPAVSEQPAAVAS